MPKAKVAKRRSAKAATKTTAKTKARPALRVKKAKKAVLLSGGNPQIAKGDGDAPVRAYIKAIPGWKRAAAENLDALIKRTVPHVRKAVKWNSPFYGVEGHGWFLSFHIFAKYIKVAFFRGADLKPVPPVSSKDKNVRYVHIGEDERMDEAQMTKWIKQAAAIPGWMA
jgi:hypothetical protein